VTLDPQGVSSGQPAMRKAFDIVFRDMFGHWGRTPVRGGHKPA
jgi:hypothetical protein